MIRFRCVLKEEPVVLPMDGGDGRKGKRTIKMTSRCLALACIPKYNLLNNLSFLPIRRKLSFSCIHFLCKCGFISWFSVLFLCSVPIRTSSNS